MNGISYSFSHKDQSAGTFYAGYFADMAVGAAVGAVMGGASAYVTTAAEVATANAAGRAAMGTGSRWAVFEDKAWRYGLWEAAQGATSNVANQFALNVIDKEIGGKDVSLDRDLLYAAGTGAAMGAARGTAKAGYAARSIPRNSNYEGIPLRVMGDGPNYGSIPEENVRMDRITQSRSMLFSVSFRI